VVNTHEELVLILTEPQDQRPKRRAGCQVHGSASEGAGGAPLLITPGVFRETAEVNDVERGLPNGFHSLFRTTVLVNDADPQDFVPSEDLPDGTL
jgi:hypothetical protein